MKKETKLMLLTGGVFVLLFVGAWLGGGLHQQELAQQCAARWGQSGYPVKYDKVTHCRVRVAGRWVPEDNVRVGP